MTAKKAAAKAPAKATSTSKHAASSSKASATAKHTAHLAHLAHVAHLAHLAATGKTAPVTVEATPAKPAKAAFAVGDLLPVCAFEAVAASLRLAGQPVSDDEVVWLWELCGSPEATPVEAALAAAARFGLAGCRPDFAVAQVEVADVLAVHCDGEVADVVLDQFGTGEALGYLAGAGKELFGGHVRERHGLILGVDVPGPHAVLATPDGWWSWGELYDPWPCTVDGAWAVSWA